jgi:hypothetical protein
VTDWIDQGDDLNLALRNPVEDSIGYFTIGTHDDPVVKHRPALVVRYALPGDVDGDGDVDLDDHAIMVDNMTGPGGTAANRQADLDGDGDCDLADVTTFAENFTQ